MLSSDGTAALTLLLFLKCANTQRDTECYNNTTADARHRPLNQQGGVQGKESETTHSTRGAHFTVNTLHDNVQCASKNPAAPHTLNVSSTTTYSQHKVMVQIPH